MRDELPGIFAGLRAFYPDPSVLVGQRVIVVANLKPADERQVSQQEKLALMKKLDAGLRDRVSDRIPGMAWAMHRFNPRRKANEAALAALEERMRGGKR